MSKLHDLHAAGQSVWYDFIRRDMIENGELNQLVSDGIRGVTSNPSIFQKAIDTSEQYDQQIRAILEANPGAFSIQNVRDNITLQQYSELITRDGGEINSWKF